MEFTKAEAEDKRLSQYIIMPTDIETSFTRWWRGLDPSVTVSVRYPHGRHGNAGKKSNSAKTSVMEDFLTFVDMNSQPNGRSADSSGPTSYFLPKFTTIQTPKTSVSNYEERVQRSVVGEFNRSQHERGRGECSNSSSHNWLKQRPKVVICPHQTDYCDTYKQKQVEIHTKQTTVNRLLQSYNSDPVEVKKIEDDITSVKQSLENHEQDAQRAHTYYMDVTQHCKKDWSEIQELEAKSTLSEDERDRLTALKNSFNLVVSADYQMAKLVPYWGLSSQPGSTYYLQKLSHDVFGVVDHSSNSSTVYLFDERIGAKNTDHTVSYLTDFVSKHASWITRLHLFLDNASSTNKNFYMMAWAYEMIQQGKLNFIRISFMVAGHTKFSPDLLFSAISQTYNRNDVFTTDELQEIVSQHAEAVIDDGHLVHDWRSKLTKYTKLPGIQSLHDFVFVKNPADNAVAAKVRKNCFSGTFDNTTMHVDNGRNISENCIPSSASDCYAALHKVKSLSDTKLKHLQQMYRDFVPTDRCLPFITINRN